MGRLDDIQTARKPLKEIRNIIRNDPRIRKWLPTEMSPRKVSVGLLWSAEFLFDNFPEIGFETPD